MRIGVGKVRIVVGKSRIGVGEEEDRSGERRGKELEWRIGIGKSSKDMSGQDEDRSW